MATIWVVEGSHTVRRMVEIALTTLPVELYYGAYISDLMSAERPKPDLLLCAQRSGRGASANPLGYQETARQALEANLSCPILLLLDQSASSGPYTSQLPIANAIRKPFKTQALIKLVAEVFKLEVPHAALFDESKRVIPLARSTKSAVTAHPLSGDSADQQTPRDQAPTELVPTISTPTASSVGSLMDAMTPAGQVIEGSMDHSAAAAKPDKALQSPHAETGEAQPSPPPPALVSSTSPELPRIEKIQRSESDLSPLPLLSPAQVKSSEDTSEAQPLSQSEYNQTTSVDIPALGSTLAQQPEGAQDVEAKVSSSAIELVRAVTDRALKVTQRVSHAQASRLTADEHRALVERVAWEVIPTIATELIEAELRRQL